MRSKRTVVLKTVSLLLVIVCFAYVLSSSIDNSNIVKAQTTDSKVQAWKDKIAQLEKDADYYEKMIEDAKNNATDGWAEKEYLDKQIANLNDQIFTANSMIIEYTNSIAEKADNIEVKSAEITQKFEQFKERMRVSYEEGTIGYLAMLFSSDSISEFFTGIERMTNMLDYDRRVMKELNDEKAKLAEEKKALEKLKEEQQIIYADLEDRLEELDAKSAESEKFYENSQKDKEKFEQMLKDAEAERKKAEAEMNAYLEELAKQNATPEYKGGELGWPLDLSCNIITSLHGWRTYYLWGNWITDYHNGIDIAVPSGTSVIACADGVVKISKWHNSYGYYIVVDHGSGYTTLYAHNNYLLVKEGDKVKKGQVIAKSGSTGKSSGPHVHLEVTVKGTRVDPFTPGVLTQPKKLIYSGV